MLKSNFDGASLMVIKSFVIRTWSSFYAPLEVKKKASYFSPEQRFLSFNIVSLRYVYLKRPSDFTVYPHLVWLNGITVIAMADQLMLSLRKRERNPLFKG